jgi:hypothetical protein
MSGSARPKPGAPTRGIFAAFAITAPTYP